MRPLHRTVLASHQSFGPHTPYLFLVIVCVHVQLISGFQSLGLLQRLLPALALFPGLRS